MLRRMKKNYRRMIAFILSVAMTCVNVLVNVNVVAYAAEAETEALFLLEGNMLQDAIEDALESGEIFDFSTLELAAGRKKIKTGYEKLIGTKEGDTYALALDIDDSYAPEGTAMQVFYNAGTDDVIFLFINQSEQVVSFRTNIDGYETEKIVIRPNPANTDPDMAVYTENYDASSMINDETQGANAAVVKTDDAVEATAEATSREDLGNASDAGLKNDTEVIDDQTLETEPAMEASADETEETDQTTNTDQTAADEKSGERLTGESAVEEENVEEANVEEANIEEADERVESDEKQEDTADDREAFGDDAENADAESADAEKVDAENADVENVEKEADTDAAADPEKEETVAAGISLKKTTLLMAREHEEEIIIEQDTEDDITIEKESNVRLIDEDTASEQENEKETKRAIEREIEEETAKETKIENDKEAAKETKIENEKETGKETKEETKESIEQENEKETKESTETETEQETKEETKKSTETETEEETKKSTETETEEETKKSTETETEEETKKSTETATEEETKKSTEIATEEETKKSTETETEEEIKKSTEQETKEETKKSTETENKEEIKKLTEAATEEEIKKSTETATEEKTKESTEKETGNKTAVETETSEKEETKESTAAPETTKTDIRDSIKKNDEQFLEDDAIEYLGELEGKTYATVTIWASANARAYKVSAEEFQKKELFKETYDVDYHIDPEDAAVIIGDVSVTEGDTLLFAVEPNEEYEIANVYVNNHNLTPAEPEEIAAAVEAQDDDEITTARKYQDDEYDWYAYDYVYIVDEVSSDLDIRVDLQPLHPTIPAATYTAETPDATFTIDAPDGAFEEAVELQVTPIVDEEILESYKEQTAVDDRAVTGILAYDVAFISVETGEEIEPATIVNVTLNLRQSITEDTEEIEEAATGISILHITDEGEPEVVAASDTPTDTEFNFDTEAFSVYVVVTDVTAAAANGEKGYTTLQNAVNSAVSGDTIILKKDINEDVACGQDGVTIDLNGHTWTGASGSNTKGNIYFTNSDTELTLIDSVGGAKLLASEAGGSNSRVVNYGYTGSTTKSGNIVRIIGNSDQKLLIDSNGVDGRNLFYLYKGYGDLYLENCQIQEAKSAVFFSSITGNATVNISIKNSDFINNAGTYGPVFLNPLNGIALNVDIEGSTFSDNSGNNTYYNNQGSGALFIKAASSSSETNVRIIDSAFKNNHSYSMGGAVNVVLKDNTSGTDCYGKLLIENTTFEGNQSNYSGGAINAQYCDLEIDDCTFTNNTTEGIAGGGAVYVKSSSSQSNQLYRTKDNIRGNAVIKDSTFHENKAPVGGAVNGSCVNLKVDGCTFEENQATSQKGGAMNIQDYSCLSMNDTGISNNHSNQSGGAIYVIDGIEVDVANSQMNGNTSAAVSGSSIDGSGAVVLKMSQGSQKDRTIKLEDVEIRDNTATTISKKYCNTGAGLFTSGTKKNYVYLENCVIAGNHFEGDYDSYGGGACLSSPYVTLINTEITDNEAATSGGGLYFHTALNNATFENCAIYKNRTTKQEAYTDAYSGYSSEIAHPILTGSKTMELDSATMGIHTDAAGIGYTLNQYTTKNVGYATGNTTYHGYYSMMKKERIIIDAEGKDHDGATVVPDIESAIEAMKMNDQNGADLSPIIYVCSEINLTQTIADIMDQNKNVRFERCWTHHGKNNSDNSSDSIFCVADTVALNGAYIDGNALVDAKSAAIEVTAGGSLTITGETRIENCINKASDPAQSGGAIHVSEGGELTIQDGLITKNYAYYGGAVGSEGTVIIKGTGLKDNLAGLDGGAVYVKMGKLLMSDGIISGNRTSGSGGAICISGGTLEMTGGELTENNAPYGGGIAIMRADSVNISKAKITNNGSNNGGGIAVSDKTAEVIISDTEITGNRAVGGGALYINEGASVTVQKTNVCNNTAFNSGYGGAFYAQKDSTLILDGVKAEENTAAINGGAVYLSGDNAKLTVCGGTELVANTSGSNGGAVASEGDGTKIRLEDCIITENSAKLGGAVYASGGALSITSETQTFENTAAGDENVSAEREDLHKSDEFYLSKVTTEGLNKDETAAATELSETTIHVSTTTQGTLTKYKLMHVLDIRQKNEAIDRYYNGDVAKITEADCVDAATVYLDPSGKHDGDHYAWVNGTAQQVVPYTTMEDAVAAAQAEGANGKIYVCSTVTVGGTIDGVNIYRCQNNNTGYLLKVKAGGTLTLKNTGVYNNEVSCLASENGKAVGLINVGSSALNIEDGTIIDGSGNKAYYGGGIVVNQGSLNMTGGEIRNCYGVDGGAIFVQGSHAVVNMDGGTIHDCKAGEYGGAIFAMDKATVNCGENGGRTIFTGNVAMDGGAIFYGAPTYGTIRKATFTNNKATRQNGGAVYIDGDYGYDVNGKLRLLDGGNSFVTMYNVYVVGNGHIDRGGTSCQIYSCPTGEVGIYAKGLLVAEPLGVGGVDIENDVISDDEDIKELRPYQGKFYISNDALGGTAKYKINGTKITEPTYLSGERFTAMSGADDETIETSKEIAENDGVVFTGNRVGGEGKGAAIANNGALQIGATTMTLVAEKVWADGAENHENDEVVVNLTRNGEPVSTNTITNARQILSAENDWQARWDNLSENESVTWGVVEAVVPGYEAEYQEENSSDFFVYHDMNDKKHKITITNSPVETVRSNLVISKDVKADENIKKTAEYQFLADIDLKDDNETLYELEIPKVDSEGTVSYVSDYVSKDNNGHLVYEFTLRDNWHIKFKNLPEGAEYTVTEILGQDESMKVTVTDDLAEENADNTVEVTTSDEKTEYTISGTMSGKGAQYTYHNFQTIDISFEKIWNDNEDQDNIRMRSVRFYLYCKPTTETDSSAASSADLSEEKEITVATGILSVSKKKYSLLSASGYDEKQLEFATVDQLENNGWERYGTIELNKENDWKYTWPGISKYADDGSLYEWYVIEDLPEGSSYTMKVLATGKITDGAGGVTAIDGNNSIVFRVKNIHETARTSIAGQKIWKDSGYETQRPDSIIVTLYGDRNAITAQKVTEADADVTGNCWNWSFDNLPKYADGIEIVYTIEESMDDTRKDDYDSTITQNTDGTYMITNTYIVPETPTEPEMPTEPETTPTTPTGPEPKPEMPTEPETKPTTPTEPETKPTKPEVTVPETTGAVPEETQTVSTKPAPEETLPAETEPASTEPETAASEETEPEVTAPAPIAPVSNTAAMVTGGAGGSSGSSGSSRFTSDSDSDDANTLIVINPEAVPRAAIPDDDNTKDMTVIQDEEVPLFALPKTGDTQHTLLWLLLTAVSALGILLIGWKRKRKDNEGE